MSPRDALSQASLRHLCSHEQHNSNTGLHTRSALRAVRLGRKYKEPKSTKLVTLEQELVRIETQSLVAEAQLTNITRQKFKDPYDLHKAAIIERAEKQIILANNARRLISTYGLTLLPTPFTLR